LKGRSTKIGYKYELKWHLDDQTLAGKDHSGITGEKENRKNLLIFLKVY
jgi:hypothetical protein